MKDNHTVLYGNGAFGIKTWAIYSIGDTIYIDANGQRFIERIPEGKASRSIDEQVKLRINARVRSKLDQGFKRTPQELGYTNTNQLGYIMPMLAERLTDDKLLKVKDTYIQPKLNGHRCLINSNGAYSRAGREINTIPEILSSMKIPSGYTFDGELYCHGVPLQTISSWAKRRQPQTTELQFHIYDIIIEDTPFEERLNIMNHLIVDTDFVRIVPTIKKDDNIPVYDYWTKYREDGYEGAILRPSKGLYEPGKRSKTLIKVKKRFDAEFKCVDITPSRDGYGILVLQTEEGVCFETFAPGTYVDKKRAIDQKEKYIGRYVTCEYAELTESGVPFHCIATGWRRDL